MYVGVLSHTKKATITVAINARGIAFLAGTLKPARSTVAKRIGAKANKARIDGDIRIDFRVYLDSPLYDFH